MIIIRKTVTETAIKDLLIFDNSILIIIAEKNRKKKDRLKNQTIRIFLSEKAFSLPFTWVSPTAISLLHGASSVYLASLPFRTDLPV